MQLIFMGVVPLKYGLAPQNTLYWNSPHVHFEEENILENLPPGFPTM